MKLVYPAIIYPCEEKEGFTIKVPDLPGCISEGKNLADTIFMGTDAACGWILDEWEDGNLVPSPSDIKELSCDENAFTTLLALDMDSYAEKYGSKAVRKNLTIPAYLNTFAEAQGINFSSVLQAALSDRIKYAK